jgi:NB-ARC domain
VSLTSHQCFPLIVLHNSQRPLDTAAEQAWPDLRENINLNLGELDGIVKHVNDVTSYSKANQDRQIKNMSLRHALIPESDEPGNFPNMILPFSQNPRFYGRAVELEKIEKYLSPKGDQSLRTYTIYGRRGVGKTEIALQFAYMNQAGFDAIFWIQCETSVSIRQSFTSVAVALNLPGADRDGHHEENLLAVRTWLKKTCWSSP